MSIFIYEVQAPLRILPFLPTPLIYGLFFGAGGFFYSFWSPLSPSHKEAPPVSPIEAKQWLLSLPKSWFQLIPDKTPSLKDIVFVKTKDNTPICRHTAPALRFYRSPKTLALSIDVYLPKVHGPLLAQIGAGKHKNHQFILEEESRTLPTCIGGPEIAYGKLR
jgi:hypothetical protein